MKRKREAAERERAKREPENKGWREEELEAAGFAGLTQVRGVYRRLMGIMG